MSKYQTCAHSAPWLPPIPLDDEEKGYPVGRFCKHACRSMAVIRDPEVCESCTQYTDPAKLITLIIKGRKTIDQVPALLRKQVEEILADLEVEV